MSEAIKKKSWGRRILWVAGSLFLLLVLVIGAVLVLLRSEWGQTRLADFISEAASSPDFQIRLQGLGGRIPFDLSLKHLSLSDAKGEWLSAENLEVEFKVWALTSGTLNFPRIHLAGLTYHRPPESKAPPEEEPKDLQETLDSLKLPKIEIGDLKLDRIALAQPFADPPIYLTLAGNQTRLGPESSINLEILRIEGSPDHLDLKAKLGGDPLALTLAVDLDEAPGGALGTLLALPPTSRIVARLEGRGPLTGWKGTLSAQAPGAVKIDADLSLALAEPKRVGLKVVLAAEPGFLPVEMATWTGNRISLDLGASWSRDQVLVLDRTRIETVTADLSVQGKMDVGRDQVEAEFSLVPKDLGEITRLSGLTLETGRPVDGAFSGPLTRPKVNLTSNMGSIRHEQFSVAGLVLNISAQPIENLEKGWAGLTSEGRITLLDPRTETEAPLPESLKIDYRIKLDQENRLDIPALNLAGGWITAAITGNLNLDTMDLAAKIEAGVTDLTQVRLPGLTLSGQAGITADIAGRIPDHLKAGLSVRLTDLKGLPAEAESLLGPSAAIKVQAELSGDQVTLRQLDLSALSKASVTGAVNLAEKQLNLDLKADLRGVSGLASQYGVSASDLVQIKAQAGGTLEDPELNANITMARVEASGRKFQNIEFWARNLHLTGDMAGRTELTAIFEGDPLSVATDLTLTGDRLTLKKLKLRALGSEGTGELGLSLETRLVSGGLALTVPDLGRVGRLVGQNLNGSASLDLKLTDANHRQGAAVEGRISGLKLDDLAAREIRIQARLDDVTQYLAGQAQVTVNGISRAGLNVRSIMAKYTGRPDGGSFEVGAQGTLDKNFDLKISGSLSLTPDRLGLSKLELSSLSLDYGQFPVRLTKPMAIGLSNREWQISGLDLDVGGGRLSGQGRMAPSETSASLNLADFNLKNLDKISPMGLGGTLTGKLELSGPGTGPRLTSEWKIVHLAIQGGDMESPPNTGVTLNLDLDSRNLKAKLELTGLGPQPGVAELSLPMRFSLSPFVLEPAPGGRLDGTVKADLDLSLVPNALNLDAQEMAGQARADLTINGPVNAPQASGTLTISEARYENLKAGVLLQDISAQVTAQGPKLTLDRLSASDGVGGQLSGQGSVDLTPGRNFPLDASIDLQQIYLVRMNLAEAKCDGQIKMAGNLAKAKVSGKITLDPVEVNIPQRLPASITEVKVEKINVPPEFRDPKAAGPPAPPLDLDLDVEIDVPGRFAVRGEGLLSEWKGNLKITGTAEAPIIKGDIELIRGSIDVLTKRFTLTKGKLSFSGSQPPSPWIQVTGQYQASDVIAIVNVSGSPTDPKIELSSDPTLPQDEILARVLFGRHLSEISAMQALTLARAALELTGQTKGSGFNLMGKTRKALHLDQLDVTTSESGGTALQAGKYISDRIYVEGQTGTEPKDQKVTVEIELTPQINLETEVGAESNSGVGINWKLDY